MCVCVWNSVYFYAKPWVLNWFMIYWFLNKVFDMYRCCEKIPLLWQVHVLRVWYNWNVDSLYVKDFHFFHSILSVFTRRSNLLSKPTRCLDHWRHLLVGTNHFGWLRLVPTDQFQINKQAQKVKKHVNSELLQGLLIRNHFESLKLWP